MPKEHCVRLSHSLFFKLLCDPIQNNFQRQLYLVNHIKLTNIFVGQKWQTTMENSMEVP